MKRIVLSVVFSCSLSFGQGTSASSSYLKLPFYARAAATGEAFVADSSHFSSMSLNPSNLFSDMSTEVLLSHSQWVQDVSSDALGLRVPSPIGAFALLITNSGVQGIEIRDIPGPAIGTFSSHSSVFQLAYATTLSAEITVGASVKYLYEKIYVDEASGFAVDLGGIVRTPLEGLSVGAAFTNVGSLSAFRSQKNDLPNRLQAGGTYQFSAMDLDISAAASYVNDLQRSESSMRLGCELQYNRSFAFRFGYQSGFDNRGLTAGLGAKYSVVDLDYAYVPFSKGFGDAHIVSIGFEF